MGHPGEGSTSTKEDELDEDETGKPLKNTSTFFSLRSLSVYPSLPLLFSIVVLPVSVFSKERM